MKRAITLLLALSMLLVLCACGGSPEADAPEAAEETAEPLVLQIDKQLQGSWEGFSKDGKLREVYTFCNGTYIDDRYLQGEWTGKPSVGLYAIGMESIQVVTQDQNDISEGQLTYTFEDGNFVLCSYDGDPLTRLD